MHFHADHIVGMSAICGQWEDSPPAQKQADRTLLCSTAQSLVICGCTVVNIVTRLLIVFLGSHSSAVFARKALLGSFGLTIYFLHFNLPCCNEACRILGEGEKGFE